MGAPATRVATGKKDKSQQRLKENKENKKVITESNKEWYDSSLFEKLVKKWAK